MKDFQEKVNNYQKKLCEIEESVEVKKALESLLDFNVSNTQLMYVLVLLSSRRQKIREDEPVDYLQIPVNYLFAKLTPFSSDDYNKRLAQQYMGRVTREAIEPLSGIISFTGWNEEYCRRFNLAEELIDAIEVQDRLRFEEDKMQSRMLNQGYMEDFSKSYPDVGKKPAPWGGECLRSNQLCPISKKAWMKLKHSKFVFDYNTYSVTRLDIADELGLSRDQRDAIRGAVGNMAKTNAPQYHDSYFIQGPGRLHTSGGPMQLFTPFRKMYIHPCDRDNQVLELDLKCAQLIILCEILGADDVRQQVVDIVKTDSIWKHIGPPDLPKPIKKIIVYGFCFGAKMCELPYLATRKAKFKYNLNYSVTSKTVNSCFSGLLQPLVELRNNWISQYPIDKIEQGQIEKLTYTNDLGMKFNLNNSLQHYKSKLKSGLSQYDNLKIGGKLLAHYAQGKEQLIIQRMLGEAIAENVLTYSYDGLSLEVSPENVKDIKLRLNNWVDQEFSGYTLDFDYY